MQVDPSPLQMTFRQPLLVIRRNLYWLGDSGGLAVVVLSCRSVERIDLKICNMNMNVVVIIYIYIFKYVQAFFLQESFSFLHIC